MIDLLLHRLGMLSVELIETPEFPQTTPIVRTNFWVLAQRVYGLKPKIVQHNKFVKNGLGNWASENQVTEEQIYLQKWER